MAVTLDDVRHVAALARLGLSDERAASLMAELNTILGHMEVLSKVDTGRAEAVTGVGADHLPLEKDAGPSVGLNRTLADFAPSVRDGFLLVPRLATHETGEES
ncbi:MAG TPA: Asp-tRNA(Asn)/Glu-tRNA(Gln) amidotransferase subunit GatC [Gemmatimonadaceae bacterium]|jgi:aspartyl-tRNA(Asn)/glutamyl-tRNA(Gln) amidotransferase subunit C